MTLLICWLAFPAVLAVLALGCGLLLERGSELQLPGSLLLPAGFALILVVGNFTTMADATAELTVPLIIGLAVAGLVLSPPWRRRIDPWAAGAVAGVFAVFAAPIVLSGQATFAGYHALDDVAVWLALDDHVFVHGRSLAGLTQSGYKSILDSYLGTGYPLGSFVPLGVGRTLIGQDGAWLFQPCIAFSGAMLALALYALTAPLMVSLRLRALIAFIGSQPALLFAFSLWSGIKEMALASILALLAALVVPTLQSEVSARGLLPLAVASAAVLSVMSIGGGIWLALLLVVTFALAIHVRGEVALRDTVAFSVLAVALSLPTLITAFKFVGPAGHTLTSGVEVGRLVRGPLSWLQSFGIWPSGDFRLDPQVPGLTYPLIVIVAAAAVVGLAWVLSRRAWGPVSYIGTTVAGSLILISFGSPWMDAKALALASPALVVAGMLGAAWAFEGGRRVEAAVVAFAICAGVLWSNALAYLHVPLAPRDRLVEFDRIGDRFSGKGPTLVNEEDPYAILHFLRKADGYGPLYGRHPLRLASTGQPPAAGTYSDLDEFMTPDLLFFRTIVLRHSPVASRPPSPYKLAWSGHYYDVWQRPLGPQPKVIAHLPLGNVFQPASIPRCRDAVRLARLAKGGRLVAARHSPTIAVALGQVPHAGSWHPDPQDPTVLTPHRAGSLEFDLLIRPSAHYDVWLKGSFQPRLQLRIDGRLIGSAREQLNYVGQYAHLGGAALAKGRHRFKIDYGGSDLHPGSAARGFALGPLVLSQSDVEGTIVSVRPQDAHSLCGKALDWVEAVRS
jgi:hypothetical protein